MDEPAQLSSWARAQKPTGFGLVNWMEQGRLPGTREVINHRLIELLWEGEKVIVEVSTSIFKSIEWDRHLHFYCTD